MKYLKMFGLAALAAALMVFAVAGTASATTLSKPGGHVNLGETITAANEGHVTLHPPFGTITCAKSTVSGTTTTTGGTGETVKGHIPTLPTPGLTFTECNATVKVLAGGNLEVHSIGNNNGTLTSNETEVTVEYFGTHCIFKTSNTDIGTVTGATTTKTEHATFDISATIPRTGGESGAFCGSTAQWTGSYKVTSPTGVNVI